MSFRKCPRTKHPLFFRPYIHIYVKGRKNKGYFCNVIRVCEGEDEGEGEGEGEDEGDKEDDGEEEDEGEGEHEVTLALFGSPELGGNEQKNYMTD